MKTQCPKYKVEDTDDTASCRKYSAQIPVPAKIYVPKS